MFILVQKQNYVVKNNLFNQIYHKINIVYQLILAQFNDSNIVLILSKFVINLPKSQIQCHIIPLQSKAIINKRYNKFIIL